MPSEFRSIAVSSKRAAARRALAAGTIFAVLGAANAAIAEPRELPSDRPQEAAAARSASSERAPSYEYVYPAPGPPLLPPGPLVMEHEAGQPLPEGYRTELRHRRNLLIGGGALLASTWAFSILLGSSLVLSDRIQNRSAFVPLFIPVVGPFVTIGTVGTSSLGAMGTVTLAVDGLAQLSGVAMLVGGMYWKKTVLVRDRVGRPKLRLDPSVPGGTLGLSLRGAL